MTTGPVLANDGGGGSGKPSENKGNERIFTGKFTAIDAASGAVTVENKGGEKFSATVPAGAKIEVNGKPGSLSDIQIGMYGGFKTSGDTVIMVKANAVSGDSGAGGDKHRIFTGKVTAIDGGSLTLTNKSGETKTFTVPADAKVSVNGKPASMANGAVDMYGAVKVLEDGKTVLEVRFYEPKGEKPK